MKIGVFHECHDRESRANRVFPMECRRLCQLCFERFVTSRRVVLVAIRAWSQNRNSAFPMPNRIMVYASQHASNQHAPQSRRGWNQGVTAGRLRNGCKMTSHVLRLGQRSWLEAAKCKHALSGRDSLIVKTCRLFWVRPAGSEY